MIYIFLPIFITTSGFLYFIVRLFSLRHKYNISFITWIGMTSLFVASIKACLENLHIYMPWWFHSIGTIALIISSGSAGVFIQKTYNVKLSKYSKSMFNISIFVSFIIFFMDVIRRDTYTSVTTNIFVLDHLKFWNSLSYIFFFIFLIYLGMIAEILYIKILKSSRNKVLSIRSHTVIVMYILGFIACVTSLISLTLYHITNSNIIPNKINLFTKYYTINSFFILFLFSYVLPDKIIKTISKPIIHIITNIEIKNQTKIKILHKKLINITPSIHFDYIFQGDFGDDLVYTSIISEISDSRRIILSHSNIDIISPIQEALYIHDLISNNIVINHGGSSKVPTTKYKAQKHYIKVAKYLEKLTIRSNNSNLQPKDKD